MLKNVSKGQWLNDYVNRASHCDENDQNFQYILWSPKYNDQFPKFVIENFLSQIKS